MLGTDLVSGLVCSCVSQICSRVKIGREGLRFRAWNCPGLGMSGPGKFRRTWLTKHRVHVKRPVSRGHFTYRRFALPKSSSPLALARPENQIPQPGGRARAPQPRGNTRYSPNCFKETCFKERCQALSPLAPLPVRPGQHLDHLGCSSSLSVYNWPQAASGQGPATGFKHPT